MTGFTMQSLSQSDSQTVGLQYSAWGVKQDAIRYFQKCTQILPSSGIHTSAGELAAYVALHHTSAFGSVVTVPEYRRKGLAETVVLDVCRKIFADGQTPYVFVNPENTASIKLYEKCGFQFQSVAHRLRYVP